MPTAALAALYTEWHQCMQLIVLIWSVLLSNPATTSNTHGCKVHSWHGL